jgi:hypothetical protein
MEAAFSLRLADIVIAMNDPCRYIFTQNGRIVCLDCCQANRSKFALDQFWRAKDCLINRRQKFLSCSMCKRRIPLNNEY